MGKQYLSFNVYEGASERITYVFDNFKKIYVSFSGGKDSTVLIHMVLEEARRRGVKVGVLIVDLEAQYKLTMDHIHKTVEEYSAYIDLYWVCLPIHLRNAVSVFDPFWLCWDEKVKGKWVREIPKEAISDVNFFPFFYEGMEFEDFVPQFGEWYANGEETACFVGIRADESLNRFRTIAQKNKVMKDGFGWTTKVTDSVYNVYPIYDWKTEDIWVYHAKNPQKTHNELYDRMYQAGLKISQMRICQPYGDDQRKGLWLFHLIEPETWGKVVARVNGANSGALYVQESGNMTGYRTIKKPENHTWESFSKLLLESMPEKTMVHYKNKIIVFVQWWTSRGYPEGIPDEADIKLESLRKVPSWRRVCKSLLRNDFWCKGLSFTQHKSEAYEKYLELQKRKQEASTLTLFTTI